MSFYDWQALWSALIDDPVAEHLIRCAHWLEWLTPWLIYLGAGYGMTWTRCDPEARRMTRRVLLPVAWFGALVVGQFAMSWGESIWRSNHRGERLTEDQLFQFPDGPNMFVGWVVFGSVIVVLTHMATRRTGLPRKAKKPALRMTPATN